MKHWIRTGVAVAGLLGAGAHVHAQQLGAQPAKTQVQQRRWQEALDAFAADDRAHRPLPGGVVFVGSSSIRLWDSLEEQFKGVPVIKRGFGGSRLADCAEHVQELVLPYQPRLVVLYAGDNDLAEGHTPREVVDSLRRFVDEVRTALPGTRVAYVSIKPSPLRAALMERVRETNDLARTYLQSDPQLAYIDVFSAMLGPNGQPRAELFLPDALHLNAQGYSVWHDAMASYVK